MKNNVTKWTGLSVKNQKPTEAIFNPSPPPWAYAHMYMYVYVKLVPSPEGDDVAVTSAQSLVPCRDRYRPTLPSSVLC